ncbi:MAG: hypothetical protein GC202_03845 [Alphaproteobacteria bacterium]|nr:hypothetical protein [Alphaproteobacteria bacterium]
MGLDLALNGVLAALLLAVIVYAIRLNRKLGSWREGRVELERATAEFVKAAERAEEAIAELKAASDASGKLLEDQTRKALSLKDDLELLVHRAEPAADRLSDALRPRAVMASAPIAVRENAPLPARAREERPAVRQSPADGAGERGPVRSQAEQELLRAIADRRKNGPSAGARA